MAEVTVSDGRVCIIKISEMESVREGLGLLKDALIDFTTSDRVQESSLDTYLFVDLSPFNIVNSSLVGILGSIIMDKKIQLLGLCSIQPPVLEVLRRFGVITDAGLGSKFASQKIKENIGKVLVFDSINEGLVCLNQT